MHKIRGSSNKNFGIVFFVVFLLISLYPILNGESLRLWALVTSIVFLILGLLNSTLLTPLNAIWFKFGLFLGKYISPLIMGIIYFALVFPTFLILKMFKKNYLNLNYDKNEKTYWVNCKNKISNMKDQF
tara:strand:- start:222 stop:608 length:387 start_codon:yes stop_codon:yes gene_type:complete